MKPLHFKVIYRNGDRIAVEIADFYRDSNGKYLFVYNENPKYEFPGFELSERRFESTSLWDQIALRVPNTVRDQSPGKPLEELLMETGGKLVTDHFEFIHLEDKEPGEQLGDSHSLHL